MIYNTCSFIFGALVWCWIIAAALAVVIAPFWFLNSLI